MIKRWRNPDFLRIDSKRAIESLLKKFPEISSAESYEFDSYIRSLESSSSRVRYAVIVSVLASILVLAALRSSGSDSWWGERQALAHVVDKYFEREKRIPQEQIGYYIFRPQSDALDGPLAVDARGGDEELKSLAKQILGCSRDEDQRYTESCQEARVRYLLRLKNFTEGNFYRYLQAVEEEHAAKVLWVEVPFLGIRFELNDLGTFSSIGLSIIGVMLLYSIARHHENVFLCLWKVRRVAESENRFNDGQSKANFLYHSMAMTQVLSRPPTLARWSDRRPAMVLPLLLFALPVIVQGLVFWNDWNTLYNGVLYSAELTNRTLILYATFGSLLLFLTSATLAYAIACETRWSNTFFEINPSLRNSQLAGLYDWLIPRAHKRYRFFQQSGSPLQIVELEGRRAWKVSISNTKSNAEGNGGETKMALETEALSQQEVKDWHFDPLVQDDGNIYQVENMKGGNLRILKEAQSYELLKGVWTIRKAAIISIKPMIFVEAVGDSLWRLEHEKRPEPMCDAGPNRRPVGPQVGVVDVAAMSHDERQVIFYIYRDRKRVYRVELDCESGAPRVEKPENRLFLECEKGWSFASVFCNGSQGLILVEERRNSFFSRHQARVRIYSPLGLEKQAPLAEALLG